MMQFDKVHVQQRRVCAAMATNEFITPQKIGSRQRMTVEKGLNILRFRVYNAIRFIVTSIASMARSASSSQTVDQNSIPCRAICSLFDFIALTVICGGDDIIYTFRVYEQHARQQTKQHNTQHNDT